MILKHKQGAIDRLISEQEACQDQRLSEPIQEKLDAALSYFKNHHQQGRMKYDQHTKIVLADGLRCG